ncbi:hypothetical protein FVEG_15685 [Fusarium verticillioides 7600]|uniref:Uncharacterized protein n=1 Tax=Gibberella moniliformis (strain M3125 / FGSC 7600) TaxID=334819 RepID=W7MAT8_GIBM7|nr:hypothetical protein FVEG_15685 [Fusarium verticillioides 7600]EWG44604.1 hypothetical protein FVEG_15685 [Fusarium verticillioides 7600]
MLIFYRLQPNMIHIRVPVLRHLSKLDACHSTRFSAPQIPAPRGEGQARPFPNATLHSTSSASGQARCCLGSTASSSCLLKVALPLKLRRLWGPFRCRLFQLAPKNNNPPPSPAQSSPGGFTYIYLICCSPALPCPSLSRCFSVPAFRRPPPSLLSRFFLALCVLPPPFTNS